MFYILKSVDSVSSQSYITQYIVVFSTLYIQVPGFLCQSYVIPHRIELCNVEIKSCLHLRKYYVNFLPKNYTLFMYCVCWVGTSNLPKCWFTLILDTQNVKMPLKSSSFSFTLYTTMLCISIPLRVLDTKHDIYGFICVHINTSFYIFECTELTITVKPVGHNCPTYTQIFFQ